VRKAGNHA